MRSTGDRLENRFIVPIARELAIALKSIHDGGIIHRDVKGMGVYRSSHMLAKDISPPKDQSTLTINLRQPQM